MKRGRGRPAKEPEDLISVDDALKVIKQELNKKYSPDVAAKLCIAKGTLRNKIWKNEVQRWPKGKYIFLSKAEVIEKLVS